MVPINYLAVIANVVVAMAVGFVWYGPLFGKQWVSLMGWSKDEMEKKMKQSMGATYALQALGALVMSFVLAHSIVFAGSYLGVSGISAGLQGAVWSWAGFIAPVTLSIVLWEGKSWKLWLLHNGYWLVLLLLMGVVLGIWK